MMNNNLQNPRHPVQPNKNQKKIFAVASEEEENAKRCAIMYAGLEACIEEHVPCKEGRERGREGGREGMRLEISSPSYGSVYRLRSFPCPVH